LLSLGQGIRSARHALDAPGDIDLALAGTDGTRRLVDCVQPGGTESVHGHRWHLNRETGQQGRHARHIAVIFTRLVGASQINFFDNRRIDFGSFQQCF
jgi:hypothetical protein